MEAEVTAIDNIQDFIRVLDENPDWLEEIRVRVLTRELLGLPQVVMELAASHVRLENTVAELAASQVRLENTFQKFVETTQEFMQTTNRRLGALEASQARLENTLQKFVETTNRRMDALEASNARMDNTVAELAASHARLENTFQKFVETTNRRMDALEASYVRLENTVAELAASQVRLEGTVAKLATLQETMNEDVGVMKGHHASIQSSKHAYAMAFRHGFQLKQTLSQENIWKILNDADTSGISRDDIVSFSVADLIMKITDSDGVDCYVAAEFSYTVDRGDTRRAIRNAEFLTRFTGLPAHAMVAGVKVTDRVKRRFIDTKRALWYELPDRIPQAD